MSISEPFIRRPIATSLLMLGVLVFGIGAYNLLPVAALPKVDFPTIAVTVNYPGASPDTMASAVATPLEQQFAALPGLAEMTSMSGVGATLITLQFDLDRNIDAASTDVLEAINAAQGQLPKNLPNQPTIRKIANGNIEKLSIEFLIKLMVRAGLPVGISSGRKSSSRSASGPGSAVRASAVA